MIALGTERFSVLVSRFKEEPEGSTCQTNGEESKETNQGNYLEKNTDTHEIPNK